MVNGCLQKPHRTNEVPGRAIVDTLLNLGIGNHAKITRPEKRNSVYTEDTFPRLHRWHFLLGTRIRPATTGTLWPTHWGNKCRDRVDDVLFSFSRIPGN